MNSAIAGMLAEKGNAGVYILDSETFEADMAVELVNALRAGLFAVQVLVLVDSDDEDLDDDPDEAKQQADDRMTNVEYWMKRLQLDGESFHSTHGKKDEDGEFVVLIKREAD
jgi:hypothetical protein